MVTSESYYTLKYAFHLARNITIDFLPMPAHHTNYWQEKFINQITEYFDKKNLDVKKIKNVLENSNISVNGEIRESNLITLKRNEQIKAKKNEEFLKIKSIIYRYPYSKAIQLINKSFLNETKKYLDTKTENLNLKELFFLKDNYLLFLLKKDTLSAFNKFLENKKIQEADFIWNNYYSNWFIKDVKKYILLRIQDDDFFKIMNNDYEHLPAVKAINVIICNLTDEDLKNFYSSTTMIPLFDRKKDGLNELKKIINKWKINYERKDLYEILENSESVKKAPNRRL